MPQKVLVDSNNVVRVLDVGPIGPTGLPGGSDSVIVDVVISQHVDFASIGGIEIMLANPNPSPVGFTLAVVGRGEVDGVYVGGSTDPEDPLTWVPPTKVGPLPTTVIYAQKALANQEAIMTGAVDGPWITTFSKTQDEWGVPYPLNPAQLGAVTAVTYCITAPNAFTTGPGEIGVWPLSPTETIMFDNQTTAENNGLYRGATTDPMSPQPLVRIGSVPDHSTLVIAGVFVASDESLALLPFGELPSGELVYEVLGPFTIVWSVIGASGWVPVSYGLATIMHLIETATPPVTTTLIIPTYGVSDWGFSGDSGPQAAPITYTASTVLVTGSNAGLELTLSFDNPGAGKYARFTLVMDIASTTPPVIPSYVGGTSSPLANQGSYEVVVHGQGDPDIGDPALVTIGRAS